MRKTWFQHDFNCSKKDGFALLLSQKNGDALYGKFWLLQEHFYSMQQGRKRFSNTMVINESDMLKVLKVNRRSIRKVLETFRECLGIVSERFQKRFGNVYKTTIPNSLIYLRKRKLISDNKILDIDKEKILLSFPKNEEKKNNYSDTISEEATNIAKKFALKYKQKVYDVGI